jgi:hypothetical protein
LAEIPIKMVRERLGAIKLQGKTEPVELYAVAVS